jgi:hypothetical protein
MQKPTEKKPNKHKTAGDEVFHMFESSTKYIFFFYLILCILFIKSLFDVETVYAKLNVPLTNPKEYLLILAGGLISFLINQLTAKGFDGFIRRNMVEKNKYQESKDQHVYRIVKIIYSIIYYTLSSSINFYLIKTFQPDHLPTFFNGTLDVSRFIKDWPSQINIHVRYFFVMSIGHHIERTLDQVLHTKKYYNFWTMLLHHILTINLMVMCFGHRQFIFGIPILLIHDITDIFLNILKIVREIKFLKKYVMVGYFLCLIAWFITRNWIFNLEIVIPLFSNCIWEAFTLHAWAHLFASFGVGILMILNSYWLFALLHAGFKKIFYNIEQSVHEGESKKNN